MPELIHNLQGRDLGHLNIIAELWGLDFSAPDVPTGLQRLLPLMLDAENLEEALSSLPTEAAQALEELMRQRGRLPWARFARQFGELREIGAGKRDRERPYLSKNATASEALWYRGLIGRAFFETPNGPEEFAYIPEDLLPNMPLVEAPPLPALGRPASQSEKNLPLLANAHLLDDACTMLAGLRVGMKAEEIEPDLRCGRSTPFPLTAEALIILLKAAGVLDNLNQPQPEALRTLLESNPGQALVKLYEAWLRSVEFNELHLTPGLSVEGSWRNDPVHTRQAVIDFISTIPGAGVSGSDENLRPFWSMKAFISAVYQTAPDFQRSAGDYDSWYIRAEEKDEFLRGFEHWYEVDGALLMFLLGGPLHWLGILDLALPEKGEAISAFRFSSWANELLSFNPPADVEAENIPITLRTDGRIRIPPQANRVLRYQLARFGEWQGIRDGFYRYRLTPASLEASARQGLRVEHLLALLARHETVVPPGLLAALKRWEAQGSLARIDRLFVLRVKKPEILQALRNSSVQRFLGESLGPNAVVVKPGGLEKVSMALAESGYLTETNLDDEGF